MATGRAVVKSFAGASEWTPEQLRDAPIHWPRPSVLDISLEALLEGVGPKLAEAASEVGIGTVGDLLLHVPHRHRDLSIVPLSELEIGAKGTVHVEVLGNTPRPFRRKGFSITSVKVGDDSGAIRASWFNHNSLAPEASTGRAPAAYRLSRQTRLSRL